MLRCLAFFLVACSLSAQPKIGIVDYYGERKIGTEKIAKALGVKEGDALPPSKLDLEEKLQEISGVLRSHVEATCCENGQAIIYAGVEERGAPHFEMRDIQVGKDLPVPSINDIEALRLTVREADDASMRADAVAMLSQKPISQPIIDDLQYAAQDQDPTVRRAAIAGIVRMALLAPTADLDIKPIVSPTWLIEMLNSVIWTDRVNAVDGLLTMTEKLDPVILEKIHERSFNALVQMARWKHLPHALPPYLLLCRVAGVSKQEAEKAWSAGDREKMIVRILKEKKK